MADENTPKFTKEELKALKKRFVTGAAEVSHGAERVRFWSPEQYMKVMSIMENQMSHRRKYSAIRVRSRSGF